MAGRTKAVAKTTEGQLPAEVDALIQKSSGRGTSTSQSDNIVPMMYVLQSNSPQVNKRNAAYIQDAEAGCIWLRNMAHPIVNGEEGVLFQPSWFTKDVVEWIPRDEGGGFVARHQFAHPEESMAQAAERLGATPVEQKNSNKISYILKNGHELVETRYFMGHVHLDDGGRIPFVVPLKGTGHSFGKQWMFAINNLQYKGTKPDIWFGVWKLTTSVRTNASGEWFMYEAAFAHFVDNVADVHRGEALYNAFASGEKQAEAPVVDEEEMEDAI